MYRRHRFYNDNPEWLDWAGIICGFGLFIALIAGAANSAQTHTVEPSIPLERAK